MARLSSVSPCVVWIHDKARPVTRLPPGETAPAPPHPLVFMYPPISTSLSVSNRIQPQKLQRNWPIRLPSDRLTFPATLKMEIEGLVLRRHGPTMRQNTEQVMRVTLCRRADGR